MINLMFDSSIALATLAAKSFPTYFVLVYVVGFVAAIALGLVAFFNSKRPVGWEKAKKPDIIPDLSKNDTDKSGQ